MAKYFATPIPGVTFNEAELRIDYPNGSKLQLFGSDKPDRLRGLAFSGVSFDEYGMHPPNVFSEVVSKALADHLGYAIFAGTIKGRNQLYQTYEALKDDDGAFTVWQDINTSLKTEEDASTLMLSRAYADDRELIKKDLMTQEEFDQEWLLSTDAAIKGAYYTTQLAAARKEKRVTRVPYDPALPVDKDWDLGVGDSTVIWFTQSLRSGEVHVIDYYENSGEGIPHYAKVIQEKPYVYGEHWAPHDIRVRELGSGKSRLETAEKHRIKFQVTPNIGVDDGIDAARLLIPRCWFDAEKCSVGLEALTFYRKAFNERLQTFTDKPGRNQLYQTYEALKDDDGAFTVWQDINTSLKTEEDASTLMLSRAYADDRELIKKGLMTQEEFDQEWLLSTDAAIKGAYYTTQLAAARKEKRVTRVPYDPALPVDKDWDLGVGDSTVIWFTQSLRSGEVHVIDYYENSGEGIPHYAKVIQEKPYVYGEHWAPHDIRVRELGSGKSRLETAEKHRIKFQVTPNIGVDDGIDAARLLIPRCWFDAEKCSVGLEALTFYRKAFNERLQTFTDKPLHDWTSHAADAFRGLAVSAKYVVHPEHSEQNGVAKQPFQTEEAPDEDSS